MAQTLRIASKAAQIASTTPVSTLRHFPPREAIFNPTQTSTSTSFSPEIWAALQNPPASALSAFAHRIGLAKIISDPEEILQACTHPSYPPFYAAHSPAFSSSTPSASSSAASEAIRSNANLSTLGNSLLGLFATEFLHATYPHLPTRVLKAAVSAYVGPATCASVAKEMGVAPLLRWNRPVRFSSISSSSWCSYSLCVATGCNCL